MVSAILEVVATGQRHALDEQREYVIGRGRDADIVLTDIAASRKHTKLRWNGRAWVAADLGSSGGTFVRRRRAKRGERIIGEWPLSDGDELFFGRAVLRFRPGGSSDAG